MLGITSLLGLYVWQSFESLLKPKELLEDIYEKSLEERLVKLNA